MLRELAGPGGQLAQRTDLRGLLFKSGKPGQFIAGADLNELAMLATPRPSRRPAPLAPGHQIFNRLSRLPFPTVALIDGNCLGGGTELVLAMDERLASTAPHTQIGLPEVKIGLIPGWGGTQRLPRLIGLNPAIEMITSGEPRLGPEGRGAGPGLRRGPGRRLVEEGHAADRLPPAERRVEGAARAAAGSRSGSIRTR